MRWLAIPAALLVLVLASLAIDTESRDGFIERVRVEEAQREQFDDIDATHIVFETADGEVVEFSTKGEGVLGKGSDGEISTLVFEPDPNGDIAGLTVNDDGTFTPFSPGEDVSGKTVIVPTEDGGFTLIRPDGSRTRIVVGENGVEAYDETGNEVALPKDSDGRLDLGDGLTAKDSDLELVGGDQALPEASDRSGDSGGFSFGGRNLLIIVLALAALAGTIWWFIAMKPQFRLSEAPVSGPRVPVVPDSPPRKRSSWDAFEAYLAELAANPDPTQAIRQAYAYAEQGMGSLVARHPEQTPSEWCSTVANSEPALAASLQSLTNRYSSIRFGDEVATNADRDQAIDELRQLVRGAFQ